MIDEIAGDGGAPEVFGDEPVGPDQNRRGPVTEDRVVGTGGPGNPLVRGGDQSRTLASRLEGQQQRRGPGPLRRAEVDRLGGRGEVEGRRDDGAVLPVGEGEGGRCQEEARGRRSTHHGEAIPSRLRGHGDRVLIPVANGSLGFPEGFE